MSVYVLLRKKGDIDSIKVEVVSAFTSSECADKAMLLLLNRAKLYKDYLANNVSAIKAKVCTCNLYNNSSVCERCIDYQEYLNSIKKSSLYVDTYYVEETTLNQILAILK